MHLLVLLHVTAQCTVMDRLKSTASEVTQTILHALCRANTHSKPQDWMDKGKR